MQAGTSTFIFDSCESKRFKSDFKASSMETERGNAILERGESKTCNSAHKT